MIHKPLHLYRPIYQMPYSCVPATLQWILYRRKLDILDQEFIGSFLGLRLPIKGKTIFKNRKIIFTNKEPFDGYGTQIEKEEYSINNFFKQNNISLKISDKFIINKEKELKSFIIKNFKKNNDIIIRYNNKIFMQEKSYGHFSIICNLNDKKNIITIGDPEPPFFKKVTLKDVLYATSNKIDNIQRGFYIVNDR